MQDFALHKRFRVSNSTYKLVIAKTQPSILRKLSKKSKQREVYYERECLYMDKVMAFNATNQTALKARVCPSQKCPQEKDFIGF
ncbi:MAG: hypothetical protein LBG21_03995 [Campylobacteraceae bacterium]|jgi:hypothetical protein|nr:hypothetical protein [Campylobacteraceae bacterium]